MKYQDQLLSIIPVSILTYTAYYLGWNTLWTTTTTTKTIAPLQRLFKNHFKITRAFIPFVGIIMYSYNRDWNSLPLHMIHFIYYTAMSNYLSGTKPKSNHHLSSIHGIRIQENITSLVKSTKLNQTRFVVTTGLPVGAHGNFQQMPGRKLWEQMRIVGNHVDWISGQYSSRIN